MNPIVLQTGHRRMYLNVEVGNLEYKIGEVLGDRESSGSVPLKSLTVRFRRDGLELKGRYFALTYSDAHLHVYCWGGEDCDRTTNNFSADISTLSINAGLLETFVKSLLKLVLDTQGYG